MKKIFTYMLILTAFFFSILPNTYALDNCSPLSSATLYDIQSYNSVSSLSTSSRKGTICSYAYIGYGDNGPTGSLGYLANLSNLYSKDTYYTVSFYLFSTSNVSLISSSLNNGSLAISGGNSANAWASSNFGVSGVSSSVNYYSYEGSSLVYFVFTYVFKANTNFDSIFIPFSSSSTVYGADFQLYGVSITNTGRDSLSSTEVNNLLTSQTEDIKNTIDNLQNNIDSTIKDTFEDCHPSKNLFNMNNTIPGWVRYTDNVVMNPEIPDYITANYIEVEPNTTYTLNLYNSDNLSSGGIMFYDSSKNWISPGIPETQTIMTFTTPTNTKYIRFVIRSAVKDKVQLEKGNQATSYEKYGEICQNKIDNTNDKLDNIQDSITSETPPNLQGLSGSAGWLPAGPVDSILNLPLTMLNSLLNNLGKSCTPLELPLPYVNRTLTLPCLNSIYAQIDGLSVWINSISIIASAFMLYSYFLKLYKWVDDTLTFRENNHNDWGGL